MVHNLRFGIITIQNTPWQALLDQWRLLESMGCWDSLWVADHFVHPYAPQEPWLEGWTALAALASHTSRVRVGALVTNIALRNPAMLARQALTIDHISGGRLNLGLGSGQPGDIGYAMLGEDDWPNAERVSRFREAVEIIDGMLSHETFDYHGRYYHVDNAVTSPRPIQSPRPPITIAALGPTMLRITARHADTWNTYPGKGVTPAEALTFISDRNKLLDDLCAEIGRDPGTLSRSLLSLRADTTSPFASVGAFEDHVGKYREAGLNEFIFYHPPGLWYKETGPEQDAVFEQVASEVIPAMKAAAAL
ncbi:MAG: LLM class flavin-dependent oxidoreductase [Chloroflexia bacterium]